MSAYALEHAPSSTSHSEQHEQFDVWNEVPLVPQTTGMSCWAAAAAMLIGWRDCLTVDPSAVASGAGRWAAFREGLEPADVPALARAWKLVPELASRLTVPSLLELLRERGPLWLGEASPGLHSIVVTGIYGDGSPARTFVRINDPWPVDRGERYVRRFDDLLRNFAAATAAVGDHIQMLHTGGRGSSGVHQSRSVRTQRREQGPGGLRWNRAAEDSERVDLIVQRAARADAEGRELDLDRRERATLGMVCPLDDDALAADGGRVFEDWLDGQLDAWGSALGRSRPHIARLIHAWDVEQIAGLDRLLHHRGRRRVCNPEEIHCFGRPERVPEALAAWANERIAGDQQLPTPEHASVLRIHPRALELPQVGDALPTYGTPMGLFQRLRQQLALGESTVAREPEFPSESELIEIVAEREAERDEPVRALETTTPASASWPQDERSLDYRHLMRAGLLGSSGTFELRGRTLAALAVANRFSLPAEGFVLFGLRGCRIVDDDDGQFHEDVSLVEDIPDHRESRCVIGVWDRGRDQVAVFRGSTVPHETLMRAQLGDAGRKANMMLTGIYDYVIGVHRTDFHGLLIESGGKLVVRTRADLSFTTDDPLDRCAPWDNLHPSFRPTSEEFSSAGCLTVRGTSSRWRNNQDAHRDPDGSSGWATLRERLGLRRDASQSSEDGRRFRMILLTGRDVHVVARAGTAAALVRLRQGSRGTEVGELQRFLAKATDAQGRAYYDGTIDDELGPRCAEAWARWQRDSSGTADAIVTPADAEGMGFTLA